MLVSSEQHSLTLLLPFLPKFGSRDVHRIRPWATCPLGFAFDLVCHIDWLMGRMKGVLSKGQIHWARTLSWGGYWYLPGASYSGHIGCP